MATSETAEEKPVLVEHVDNEAVTTKEKALSSDAAAAGQGVSGYETLTLWETAKKFKIGIMGNIIANSGFVKQFGTGVNENGDKYLVSGVLSAWNAVGAVGQIIGMVSLTFLSSRLGRKLAMYWLWSLLTVSIILDLWFSAGQFFAPVALQVMLEKEPDNYLTPIYTQWSQIGLMIIIYLLVPESPAWCASKGKEKEAKKMLRKLHWDIKDYDVDHQYNLLLINVEHERAIAAEQSREKWYNIFKGQDGLRTMISAWTLMTQQLIGLGIFGSYATYFFQQTGLKDPFKITCMTSGINIFFSIVVIYLADATGRRWMACYGSTICWGCCVVVGILGVVPSSSATYNAMVFFTVLWNVGLVANGATGWGFRLRPYTAGFAAASTCVVGTVIGTVLPYMINAEEWNWGLKTAWLYVGLGAPFTIGMWFLIPETKGRSAAELDELFERKIKPFRFHKTTTVTQRLVEMNGEGRA
ncbi:hypothetical protein CEP54_004882 [Fusarium duplospermum]|uniref:Major facilitator superfamily (MFS) profile domain-containing protein n=1 Tax=Fusarium duplospermum TaxID=1325734 RepID=A0A428QFG9_9HYPO|nr:hypothetical protein CEP54_004882 [Fusarium duplospermum]